MLIQFLECLCGNFRSQEKKKTVEKKVKKREGGGGGDEAEPRNRKASSGVGRYSMVMGSSYIPKRRKSSPLGEDAHFLCEEKLCFGLADGVGGWFRKGIDSGEYARQLMENSLIALNLETRGAVNLARVLGKAFGMTKSKGSSTALIITLRHPHDADDDDDDNHSLHALNVGDCGFMLFRQNRCIFRSPTQQRRFNLPYQLGNSKSSDSPDIASEIVVPVRPGDIVVAGTDGLLDNMFEYEIEAILSSSSSSCRTTAEEDDDRDVVGELASKIAKCASSNSGNANFDSPFSHAAKLAGQKHVGGKIDDISVVVAIII